MNLNFSVEEFLEGIEKVKSLIPEKPTIVVKNATVTGVKLNSQTINSIPKDEGTAPYIYDGLKVYQDDSLDKPRFIVEGEIETKKYLKWEDIEFKDFQQKIKVRLGNLTYVLWYVLEHGDPCVEFTRNQQQVITLYGSYPEDIQFFNNLHLEVIENE